MDCVGGPLRQPRWASEHRAWLVAEAGGGGPVTVSSRLGLVLPWIDLVLRVSRRSHFIHVVRLWAGGCFAVCVRFSALSGGALSNELHHTLILEQNSCKNTRDGQFLGPLAPPLQGPSPVTQASDVMLQ